jgi:hypothetical protein
MSVLSWIVQGKVLQLHGALKRLAVFEILRQKYFVCSLTQLYLHIVSLGLHSYGLHIYFSPP